MGLFSHRRFVKPHGSWLAPLVLCFACLPLAVQTVLRRSLLLRNTRRDAVEVLTRFGLIPQLENVECNPPLP
jgi:hypothetical protein